MAEYTEKQKLDFVLSALKIQNERVKLGAIFRKEAELITALAKKTGAIAVSDFGCWTGILAVEIFKAWPELKTYRAVEAVPLFVEFAKDQLKDHPVEFIGATLVPRLLNLPEVTHLSVNPFDTLNTASIFTTKKMVDMLVKIPVYPNTSITPFVQTHPELFKDDVYVKIDLDGVDIATVETVLSQKQSPAVIQFEVWKYFYDKGLPDLIDSLNADGYRWPSDLDYKKYTHFSIALSRGHGWWFVGYSPNPYDEKALVSDYKVEF